MRSISVSLYTHRASTWTPVNTNVDGYHRDMNVFADDITIEDDMSVLVHYESGVNMTYHLTAYSVSLFTIRYLFPCPSLTCPLYCPFLPPKKSHGKVTE